MNIINYLKITKKKGEAHKKNTILQIRYFKYVEMLQNSFYVYPRKAKKQGNQILAQKKTFSSYRNFAPEERYTSIAVYDTILEIMQFLEQEKVDIVNKLD